jgi:betaine-aldehyde dehydrogenase
LSISGKKIGNFINGKMQDGSSDEIVEVLNPSTEETLGAFSCSTDADVAQAVDSAWAAFGGWSKLTPGSRSDVLRKLGNIIEENIEELVELEVIDAGKPYSASRNGELPGIIDSFRLFANSARIMSGQSATDFADGHTGFVKREPLGVIAGITPWNFPLWQAIWKIAPALATGNTVVIKPSELTPLSTLRFAELAAEVLPAGVLNVVNGLGPTTGAALVANPKVQLVSFTGSTVAGQAIASLAGKAPKRVVMELGGNSPVIIFDDADLDAAVESLTGGYLYNAGQECMAATRWIAHEAIAEDFLDAMVKSTANNVKMGDPMDKSTTLGPMISEKQRTRAETYLKNASKNAEIVIGGGRGDSRGFFLEPTIVRGVAQGDDLVQEEMFAPIATLQTFKDESQALEMANGVRHGLAGSIWTRDIGRALRLANSYEFGTAWINSHMVVGPDMPIGGFRESGYGKEGGALGMEEFTRVKQIIISQK